MVNMAKMKPPSKPYSHASLKRIQNSDEYLTDANQIEFAHTMIA
jgi:hypothetical protein